MKLLLLLRCPVVSILVILCDWDGVEPPTQKLALAARSQCAFGSSGPFAFTLAHFIPLRYRLVQIVTAPREGDGAEQPA